jgi:hypothetical protein
MFYIIVILAAIFAMPASAQSIKEQLVGTWTLTSCSGDTFHFTAALCRNPNGIHILDARDTMRRYTRHGAAPN